MLEEDNGEVPSTKYEVPHVLLYVPLVPVGSYDIGLLSLAGLPTLSYLYLISNKVGDPCLQAVENFWYFFGVCPASRKKIFGAAVEVANK